jgi:hypothetical protein
MKVAVKHKRGKWGRQTVTTMEISRKFKGNGQREFVDTYVHYGPITKKEVVK